MINADFKRYQYYTYSTNPNAYGERTLNTTSSGTIDLAIYLMSQELSGNINYKDASYVAFAPITQQLDDTYVINYNNKMLKVLYVYSDRVYKHCALVEI
jgi:hypothetical protein